MSCSYYWWNNHYACRKSGKDVNEDIYQKYCKNYNYDDCPIYKGDSGSSDGCFLTSACVDAMGLPDDCRELTVLRAFRDNYMRTTEQGQADILDYYTIAPDIVKRINESGDSQSVFERIYRELVLPCVALIDEGQNEKAYGKYKDYTLLLKKAYNI